MATETVPLNSPSFAGRRAVLVRTVDAHCASFWDESQEGFEREHDGPTHLIVGVHAGDDALGRLASQFSMGIGELQTFRDNAEPVPNDLRERFTPNEAPVFQLLRRCGDVRLWSSTTTQHEAFGQTRPPVTRYHIAEGDELLAHHIVNLEGALANFEQECRRESTNDTGRQVQHGCDAPVAGCAV